MPKSPVRVGVAPNVKDLTEGRTNSWFQEVNNRLNIYSGTSNPTVAQVPEGQWIVYRNTTSNQTRIWANTAGTLTSTAAFT